MKQSRTKLSALCTLGTDVKALEEGRKQTVSTEACPSLEFPGFTNSSSGGIFLFKYDFYSEKKLSFEESTMYVLFSNINVLASY